jgi:hypothetical protein
MSTLHRLCNANHRCAITGVICRSSPTDHADCIEKLTPAAWLTVGVSASTADLPNIEAEARHIPFPISSAFGVGVIALERETPIFKI